MLSLDRGSARDVWLPECIAFLSGLPEAARRRRALVPIQAYVDDSGNRGNTRHFVLAGLVGHSEDWAAFSEEWAACLAESPSVSVFKMAHAAARSGEFYRWTEQMRDDKLRALARIINRHAKIATWSAIDLEAHAETWAKRLPKPHSETYFYPYHCTIMATCFALWDRGWREPFEIIFDEQVVFGPRARAWYPIVKGVVAHKEPEAVAIMPVDPMFRSDTDFLPIQAADLFAWCIRKATDDPTFTRFEWLLAEMPNVKQTDYSQYYDRERMESVMAQTEAIMRDGLPEELMSLVRGE